MPTRCTPPWTGQMLQVLITLILLACTGSSMGQACTGDNWFSCSKKGYTAFPAIEWGSAVVHIFLDDNEITSIPSDAFGGLAALETLHLDDNLITAIPIGLFDDTTALQDVWMHNNAITSIPSGVFDHTTALILLFLDANAITVIPTGLFDHNTALKYVFLDANAITVIPTGLFDHNIALEMVSVGNNTITVIPSGLFEHTTLLEAVGMHANTITSIPSGLFDHTTLLETVWLSDNAIIAIPTGLFDHNDNATFERLLLSGNPLVCSNTENSTAATISSMCTSCTDGQTPQIVTCGIAEVDFWQCGTDCVLNPNTNSPTTSPIQTSSSPTGSPVISLSTSPPSNTPTVQIVVDQGEITIGQTKHGDTSFPGSPDHTYNLTITSTQVVTITTCSVHTTFDTMLALYRNNSLIAQNDDTTCGGSSLFSTIVRTLAPGTYTVLVEGYGVARGKYSLAVSAPDVPSPPPAGPTSAPMSSPPTNSPTASPTTSPTTSSPTTSPTTSSPTLSPTISPSSSPTSSSPTSSPTTSSPTTSPTSSPTTSPTTSSPTNSPTTSSPTSSPTTSPTSSPTKSSPTTSPTSSSPTISPTTSSPTTSPTSSPTTSPTTSSPTNSPTTSAPTSSPTTSPTNSPTSSSPTTSPTTSSPTTSPTSSPTSSSTTSPTFPPTTSPTTSSPTKRPSPLPPTPKPTIRSPTITSPTKSYVAPTTSAVLPTTVGVSPTASTQAPLTLKPTIATTPMANGAFYLTEGVGFRYPSRFSKTSDVRTWTAKVIDPPAARSLSNPPKILPVTGDLFWESPLPSVAEYMVAVRAEYDDRIEEATIVMSVSTQFSAVITSASIDGNTVNITSNNLTSSNSVIKTTLVAEAGFPSTMLHVSGTLVAPDTIDHMLLFVIVDDEMTTYSVAVNSEMSRFDTVVQLPDNACGPIHVGTSHPAPTMYNDLDNLVSQFQVFIVSIDTLVDSAPLSRAHTVKTSPIFGQGPTVLNVVVAPCWQESILQSIDVSTSFVSKGFGTSALQVVVSEPFVDGSGNISIFAPTDVSVASQRTTVLVNVITTVVTPIIFPGDAEQHNETMHVASSFIILVDPIIPSAYLVASTSAVHAQILLHSDSYSKFVVDIFNEGNEDAVDVMIHLEVDDGLTSDADISLTSPTWLPRLAQGEGHQITVSALYPAVVERPVPLQAVIRVTTGSTLQRITVPIVLWPSTEVGTNVTVYLFDEYTVYDPKSPAVTNLQVGISALSLLDTATISSKLSSPESVKKLSNENGTVTFEGLQPGYYHVTATPDQQHRQTPTLLLVVSGEFTIEKRIFVPLRLTDVRWRLVPSAYIDRYVITLDVTFTTHVYAPVIIVSPAMIDIADLLQDPSRKEITFNVTNVGLIAADFSVLHLVSRLGEFIRLDVPEGGIVVGRIPALTSVMVSVNITIDDSSQRRRRQTTESYDSMCQETYSQLVYEFDCGVRQIGSFPVTFRDLIDDPKCRGGNGSGDGEPRSDPDTRCIPNKRNCGCRLCGAEPSQDFVGPAPPTRSPPPPTPRHSLDPKFFGIGWGKIPQIVVDAKITCYPCLNGLANMLVARALEPLNDRIEAANHLQTVFAAVGFGKLYTFQDGKLVEVEVTSEDVMDAAMYGAGKLVGAQLTNRRRNSKSIESRRTRGLQEEVFDLGWRAVCKIVAGKYSKYCNLFNIRKINEKLQEGVVVLKTALCFLDKRKRQRQLLGPTKLLTEDAAVSAYLEFAEQVQAFNDIRAPVLYLFGQNTSGDPHWLTELMDADDAPSVPIRVFVTNLLNASDDGVLDFEEWSYLTQLSHEFNSPHLHDDIQHSLQRWNNTIRLNALGIYTVADFQSSPTFTDGSDLTLFAATDTFKSKSAVAVAGLKQASDKGYKIAPFSGVIESYNKFAEVMARPVQDGVCAKVRIRIEQEVVFTRFAVRAELELENFQATKTIRNVTVNIEVFQEAINSIVTLQGLNSSIDDFAILQPTVEIFSPQSSLPVYVNMSTFTHDTLSDGVDALPDVPPLHRMKVVWVLIPLVSAAPTESQVHLIGGKLSYVAFADAPVTEIVLHPTPIRVLPSPILELAYFAPSQLEGDDPFTTDIVEPSKPAPLCVVVHNRGFGDAISLQITSSQPKIIDNEKGLAVSFRISGSFVNQQETSSSSLSVDFGTIAANSTSVACWYLVSSIQGTLSDMQASFQQLGPLGQLQQPLIDKITTNTHLLRLVRLESEYIADDGVADLLYRDPTTDQLFVLDSNTNDAIDVTDYPISLKHQPLLGFEGQFEVTNETIQEEEGEVHFNLPAIRLVAGNETKHHYWTLLSIETTRLQSRNGPRTFVGGNRTCFIEGKAEQHNDYVYFGSANVWVDRFRLNIKGEDDKTEHWLRIFDQGISDSALNCTYTLKWKGLGSPQNLRMYRGTETVPEEGAIAVQWDRVTDATGYQVEWRVVGATEYTVFDKLVIGLGIQLVDLPLNETLEIQVRSRRNGFLEQNGSVLSVVSTTSTASTESTGPTAVSTTQTSSLFESDNATTMGAFVFQQPGIRYYHTVIHKDIAVNSEILMLVAGFRHINTSFDANITYVLEDKEGIFSVDASTGSVAVITSVNQSMTGFHVYDVMALSTRASGPPEVVRTRLGVYILSDLDLLFITIQLQEGIQQYNETAVQDIISIAVCPNSTCAVTVWNHTVLTRRRDSSLSVRVAFYVTGLTLTPATPSETPSSLDLIPHSIVMNAVGTAIQDGNLNTSSSEFRISDVFSLANVVTSTASASLQTITSSPRITTSKYVVFEEPSSEPTNGVLWAVIVVVVLLLVIAIAVAVKWLLSNSKNQVLVTKPYLEVSVVPVDIEPVKSQNMKVEVNHFYNMETGFGNEQ